MKEKELRRIIREELDRYDRDKIAAEVRRSQVNYQRYLEAANRFSVVSGKCDCGNCP